MLRAKPLLIDVVPGGVSLASLGYPKSVSRNTSGIFWDQPSWGRARLGLRAERLDVEPALAVHEMAHAIHYLKFTEEERRLIYKVLRPSFGSRAAMDEVFAIYNGSRTEALRLTLTEMIALVWSSVSVSVIRLASLPGVGGSKIRGLYA